MALGLTNAAIVSSSPSLMTCNMLQQFVYTYLHDILISSRMAAEHMGHVPQVLQRLLENKLFVKAEKYEFNVLLAGSGLSCPSPRM